MDEVIVIESLTKDYGNNQGIFDINLNIIKGEMVGFVGTNGSGKTTFLKRLIYDGISNIDGITAREGTNNYYYMPQKDVIADISIDKIIDMTSDIDRVTFDNILARFDITDTVRDTDMSSLSGGELKKINIALAFASNKEVIILDEPGNNLDAKGIDILMELMEESSRDIILVSHDRQITESANIVKYNIDEIKNGCA